MPIVSQTLADEMHVLVEEFGLAQGRTACRWVRGWAEARKGQPLQGYRLIREGYDENVQLGMLSGGSEVLGYAAEALLLAGDCDGAGRELDEAFRVAHAQAERVYLTQLFLIQAGIARARGAVADAQASLRRAIAEARAQEATWLEWVALAELCEHDGATAEDREALAAAAGASPKRAPSCAFDRPPCFADAAQAPRSARPHAFLQVVDGSRTATESRRFADDFVAADA